MSRSSSSRGCASCGGGSYTRSPSPPTSRAGCGCGCGGSCGGSCGGGSCGCGGGKAMVATRAQPIAQTRTYDAARCPTFAMSCETKQALRDCAKVALCDLMRCVSEALCPDGKFDLSRFQDPATPPAAPRPPSLRDELLNCVGQAACSFMHCVPEVLCPDGCDARAPADCLPCGYAVEVVR